MRLTFQAASRFGRRDWVENAAVKVYNVPVSARRRTVGAGEPAAAGTALPVAGGALDGVLRWPVGTPCRCSWPRGAAGSAG